MWMIIHHNLTQKIIHCLLSSQLLQHLLCNWKPLTKIWIQNWSTLLYQEIKVCINVIITIYEYNYIFYELILDLFTLDKDSGFLYSAMPLNGKKGVYLIKVDVFDGVFRDQANVNITVLDVNQNQPTFIQPSTNNSTLSIPEVSSSFNIKIYFLVAHMIII